MIISLPYDVKCLILWTVHKTLDLLVGGGFWGRGGYTQISPFVGDFDNLNPNTTYKN